MSTWGGGNDPTIYGFIDIDVTRAQAYLTDLRASSGRKITITHLVGAAIARAFGENPECNGLVSLGRMKRRSSVDVFFQVAFEGGQNLSGAKVVAADTLSVPEIADQLEQFAARIRERKDTDLQKSSSLMKSIPGALLAPVLRLSEFAMFDLGMNLSKYGIPFDPFGTVMVTNVGVFDIEQGFAPLLPLARSPALMTIGKIRDKVIAVDGAPVVRPVVTIGGTFDHRVIDGYHLGQIGKAFRRVMEDPAKEFLRAPA